MLEKIRMIDAVRAFTEWRKFKVKTDTWKGYDWDLKRAGVCMNNPYISDITVEAILRLLNLLKEAGWGDQSLMRKAIALRKFFEWCRRMGYEVIDEELVPMPYREFRMPRVADDEDLQKLLRSFPSNSSDPRHVRNEALIRLYADTGARNEELLMLDLDMIDVEARRAVIRTEKSRGRRPFREIYWTEGTAALLARWMRRRAKLKSVIVDKQALFISLTGTKFGQRLSRNAVCEMMRRQCIRAGLIKTLNAHSLRHRRGRKIIEAGGSNSDVMNVLGHSNVASTTIYTVLQGKELEARARHFMEKDCTSSAPSGMLENEYGNSVPGRKNDREGSSPAGAKKVRPRNRGAAWKAQGLGAAVAGIR